MTAVPTLNADAVSKSLSRTAAFSIGVACAVMALKYAAYAMTGSVALYSDALESIVNIVTGVAAYIAIRISAKPATTTTLWPHQGGILLRSA